MTHSERFIELTKIYPDIFIDAESFAIRLGYKRPTSVWNWMKNANPNSKNRAKISDFFGLKIDIWIENFSSQKSFQSRIKSGEFNIISKRESIEDNIDRHIYGENKKDMIETEERDEPLALFETAKRLKSENRAKEALELIEKIESSSSNYKYANHNKIAHLKAILLSHDTIQDWDGALDILKRLYSSAKYHLQKPEIVTLIASNYKRKALSSRSLEEIDMDLLLQAYAIYREGYKLKDSQERYYDAINFAYLHNIIDKIEPEYADKQEIKELYQELKGKWRIDTNNWWEVSSDAEFLMLIDNIDLAILNINNFLERNSAIIDTFEIETTLRQLKIYIDFTEDANAIKLHQHLRDSLSYLKA